MKYEEALVLFAPMISACLRRLGIYKNHESFRQTGRIGIWIALEKYDGSKGPLVPFVYQNIYGLMLDQLKKENFRDDLWESEALTSLIEKNQYFSCCNEKLCIALEELSAEEKKLIVLLYTERFSLKEISMQLNITISGVKKRRERILRKLREKLE